MTIGNRKEGFSGHPRCKWCRQRFYANEQLTKHFTENHFSCHLCDRQGLKNIWFKDYHNLDLHFGSHHFLCHDPECRSQRFVAFEDEFQLQAHVATAHPGQLRNGKIKFNYVPKKEEKHKQIPEVDLSDEPQTIDAGLLQSHEVFPTLGDAPAPPPLSNGSTQSTTPYGAWCGRSVEVRQQAEDFPTLVSTQPKQSKNSKQGAWGNSQQAKHTPPPQTHQRQPVSPPPPPPPSQVSNQEDFPSLGRGSVSPETPPVWVKQVTRKKVTGPPQSKPPKEFVYCNRCGLRASNLKGGLCAECTRNQWPSMPKATSISKGPPGSLGGGNTKIPGRTASAGKGKKKKKANPTGLTLVRNSAVTGRK